MQASRGGIAISTEGCDLQADFFFKSRGHHSKFFLEKGEHGKRIVGSPGARADNDRPDRGPRSRGSLSLPFEAAGKISHIVSSNVPTAAL